MDVWVCRGMWMFCGNAGVWRQCGCLVLCGCLAAMRVFGAMWVIGGNVGVWCYVGDLRVFGAMWVEEHGGNVGV